MDKYQNSLIKFVNSKKTDPNVVGIIVSGSYVHSHTDKNSDLDVYIVLKDSKTRQRGNTWVDGVEIDYFINPVKQIRHYFAVEIDKPAAAHMFANCKVLYQKGKILQDLIQEGQAILASKRPVISNFEMEVAKHHIDNLKKDLEDSYLANDFFTFRITQNNLLKNCLENFYKVKRAKQLHAKQLHGQIKKIDPNFEKLFVKAISTSQTRLAYKTALDLAEYTENLLGGKRPMEWKIISDCEV